MIQLEHVSKHFSNATGQLQEVLNDISLEILKGDAMAIVGPSGSGKSSLLNIIGGLDKPSSGKVLIGDRQISALSEKESAALRNSEIGFVFQQHHLLPQLNLMENILLPTLVSRNSKTKEAVAQRIDDLIEAVRLSDKKLQYPGEMSGGECQRAAVVRALVNEPSLLLADEPTGSLDQHSANEVGKLLSEINKKYNLAMVVVTHSMKLAEQMPSIYELKDGKLLKIK